MNENSTKTFRGLKFAPLLPTTTTTTTTFIPKVVEYDADDDDDRRAEDDEDAKHRKEGILRKGFFVVAQSSKEPICKTICVFLSNRMVIYLRAETDLRVSKMCSDIVVIVRIS